MRNQKTTTVVVTRVFAGKSEKLFDLYANYVAKRIMFESGTILREETNFPEENIQTPLDISDLMW